jgi:RNA polymerase sigma-70 factor (sigma-B/F/G subfamily)
MLGSSGLDRCGDLELLGLVKSLPDGSQVRNSACELLVHRYQSLVRSCVRRYRDSPEPEEDLMQVGYVGLFRAIRDFDPAIGASLAAYAQPCISGEIKRHFRDNRWYVHVRRSVQELRLEIRQARAELTQRLSRMPGDGDLARHLDVSDAELLEARSAELAFHVRSLDAPVPGTLDAPSVGETLGGEDPQLDRSLEMQAVWAHMGALPEREQRVLVLRFYGNMSQREIGGQLGISQMHVSRLLTRALGYLRERVFGPEGDGTAGDDAPAAEGYTRRVGLMPGREELPSTLRRSSKKAQDTWIKAHDSAVQEYGEGERSHRTAYGALKHTFEKVGDHWEPKDGGRKGPSDPQSSAPRNTSDESYGGVDVNASKDHLLSVARRLGVRGRSSMNKKELAAAIQKANDHQTRQARSG